MIDLLRAINTLLYWSILFLVSFFPTRLSYRFASLLGSIKYSWNRRPIQLNKALMEARDPGNAEKLIERSFQLSICEDLEACLFGRMRKETISSFIEFRGINHVSSALEKGKGAILYTGHVKGLFTFLVALGILDYKPTIIGLPAGLGHNPAERWILELRNSIIEQRTGCRFLYIRPGTFSIALQAARVLMRNEVVVIAIDKPASRKTVNVSFLNDQAPFPTGPAVLAQTTGAPLISVYTFRTERWHPQIADIGPPLYVSDDILGATQHCASQLEKNVLQHPAEWYLFHQPAYIL